MLFGAPASSSNRICCRAQVPSDQPCKPCLLVGEEPPDSELPRRVDFQLTSAEPSVIHDYTMLKGSHISIFASEMAHRACHSRPQSLQPPEMPPVPTIHH